MRQRCRRGVHRDRHVGLLAHLDRHLGHGHRVRRLHRHRTCLASGLGLGGSASLPAMDGVHRPDAQRHRVVRNPACQRLACRYPADRAPVGHRCDRLDVGHPDCGHPDVAYRPDQPGHRADAELGGRSWKKMGYWPRVGHGHPASGLA